MKKIISVLIIAMLLIINIAAASPIDDLNNMIGSAVQSITTTAKTLSIGSVGGVTVKCASGATCGQSGENWLIDMTAVSNAQTIDLMLPAGTTYTSGSTELKATTNVIIEVVEKNPTKTVPVTLNTNYKYLVWEGFTYREYSIPNVYERSGISSTVTTNYDISLEADGKVTPPISKSYNYLNPQTIQIKDSAGNTATITPVHQVSGGLETEISGVLFVDNGFGTYEMFDKTNFEYYRKLVYDEEWWNINPWAAVKTWSEFERKMRTKGLTAYTDIPVAKSGNNMILTYPAGSVGTRLQALIPKPMAKTVTIIQHWGDPVIDSAVLSPASLIKGQGMATLTVKVTNKGSSDTINVAATANGATVSSVVNSLTLAQNQQGIYIFNINPTVSASSDVLISVIVTAGGSGIQAKKDVILGVTVTTPQTPTQKVSVTALTPEGATLSNAPIIRNGEQVAQGHYEAILPLGTYTFKTSNESNPKLYAPTPVEIILTGGETKIVNLRFSDVPTKDGAIDLTWLFWAALFIIAVLIMIKAGFIQYLFSNPGVGIIIIIVFVALWLIYLILVTVADILNNPALPWNWFS